MSKVKIFTDSCSDLNPAILDQYNIKMLPTPVHFGDELFLDRENLLPGAFYKMIVERKELPKTSQITPAVFKQEFEQALAEGYQVLSINFSSKLSGIFQSAVMAKEELGSEDIHIIDTRSASVGFGMSVIKAAKLLEEGMELKEVIAEVIHYASHMQHIFAVGSLEMLERGGRIKKSAAIVGNVLRVKPILHFQDGEILPLSKVRGKKKMLEFLMDIMEERGDNIAQQEVIGINHSANPELAEEVRQLIQERFQVKNFIISEIGAAIGSHVGRDTVSVFFQSREKVANAELR